MDLYIVRHGIAIDREDPKSPPEAERFLTEEGIERTRQVAKGIAALGVHADLLISSPYVRAKQTAVLFAKALEYSEQKIRQTDNLLPGAEPGAFLRELAREKNVSVVFCFGHAPSLADLCLVPQLANARRFGVDVNAFPRLLKAETAATAMKAFADAAPDKQPDAE